MITKRQLAKDKTNIELYVALVPYMVELDDKGDTLSEYVRDYLDLIWYEMTREEAKQAEQILDKVIPI